MLLRQINDNFMDYTSIRQLFYKERSSLDDFDVLAEDENVFVNSFLYNRLLQIDYLHPKYDYANEETLRIFNDVYYFMTLFFRDKNPLMHYADYRKIPNPEQNKDKLSQYRTWVEFSMIYVIMVRWNIGLMEEMPMPKCSKLSRMKLIATWRTVRVTLMTLLHLSSQIDVSTIGL